ncbi:hypothetical protein BH09GEM1_BH09GEM1_48160 [soil metagenome]
MKNWTTKKWLSFILLFVAVSFVAKQCGRIAAEHQNTRDARNGQGNSNSFQPVPISGEQNIVALVARQPSEGVTEDQMDTAFIERFGQWVAERIYANAVKHQRAEGGTAVEPMTPESVIVESAGKRFGVVRLRSQGATLIATIVGIDGTDIVRVTCVSKTIQDVPIGYGACGEKIKETFGTAIGATQ